MTSPGTAYDPASYRDRRARVFYRDGDVLRGLTSPALEAWECLSRAPFFLEMVRERKIVATDRLPSAGWEWAGLLRHERVPLISYPYEWPFGMLQKAADLQLEIIERGLRDGISVRDATPYNIQWLGHRPVFIDVASFEPFVEGSLWTGYRQFCELFLFPLLLQAYRGVDFHPWLKGNIDGIPAAAMARLLSVRDRLKPGVLTHVDLQNQLQGRFRDTSSQKVERSVRNAGNPGRSIIELNVRRLRRLISKLSWRPHDRGWLTYERQNTYSEADFLAKEKFVHHSAMAIRPAITLDIGCNTGFFSRAAAEAGGLVVAVDSDHGVVEQFYRRIEAGGPQSSIVPLVWDAVNPSPGLGWNGNERPPLTSRIAPDLLLALALIHHLVIGRNVPMNDVMDFFASFKAAIVIEFVDRSDPMVTHLLAQKNEDFGDYSHEQFRSELERRFEVIETLPLPSGSRTLYLARPLAPRPQIPDSSGDL